jgi:hypothetical protein
MPSINFTCAECRISPNGRFSRSFDPSAFPNVIKHIPVFKAEEVGMILAESSPTYMR